MAATAWPQERPHRTAGICRERHLAEADGFVEASDGDVGGDQERRRDVGAERAGTKGHGTWPDARRVGEAVDGGIGLLDRGANAQWTSRRAWFQPSASQP